MFYRVFYPGSLLLAVLFVAAPATASDAAEEMSKKLSGWTSLGLRFVQHTYNEQRRPVERRTGRIWIKKPRRFRVLIEKPTEEISVSDGNRFWIYDPLLKQVQQGYLKNRWETAPLLLISDDPRKLSENWTISASGKKRKREYVIRPKSREILFQKITLRFDGDVPAELQIVDQLDQLVRLRFSRPEIDAELEDSVFVFVPPPDADVIVEEETD